MKFFFAGLKMRIRLRIWQLKVIWMRFTWNRIVRPIYNYYWHWIEDGINKRRLRVHEFVKLPDPILDEKDQDRYDGFERHQR